MQKSNIELKVNFTQVVVWPATTIPPEQVEEFEEWVEQELGARCQFLETIITTADSSGPGGRSDLLFAVHDEDVGPFAVQRLRHGMRWLDDVVSPINGGCQIYPARVTGYRSWTECTQVQESKIEIDDEYDPFDEHDNLAS